uniref:Uncharacterized protein n=1 Tax=Parascaris univalens TaxID=6257 RepID=A0A914ZU46_PARUN
MYVEITKINLSYMFLRITIGTVGHEYRSQYFSVT